MPSSDARLIMAFEEASARGVPVSISGRRHAKDEAGAAAAWILERHADGIAWRDCVVVAPGKRNWREPLAASLSAAGVPYRMLLGEPDAVAERGVDQVHVMTLHAAAESTFAAAAVVGAGDLPWKRQTLDDVSALLAAVVTTTTRALAISWSKPSALAERLGGA